MNEKNVSKVLFYLTDLPEMGSFLELSYVFRRIVLCFYMLTRRVNYRLQKHKLAPFTLGDCQKYGVHNLDG